MKHPNYHSISIATFEALAICAGTASAAMITLNTTQQGIFGDPGICSHQEAIFSANYKTASFQPPPP